MNERMEERKKERKKFFFSWDTLLYTVKYVNICILLKIFLFLDKKL